MKKLLLVMAIFAMMMSVLCAQAGIVPPEDELAYEIVFLNRTVQGTVFVNGVPVPYFMVSLRLATDNSSFDELFVKFTDNNGYYRFEFPSVISGQKFTHLNITAGNIQKIIQMPDWVGVTVDFHITQ